ncbi:MAG: FAD-binding protein [Chloroflexi bacterium]|nr:FAD-binding protein [Chloroflexota bacterium]
MRSEHLQEVTHDLRRAIRGEVRTDPASRMLYSTDGSIYQILPLGVVFPRDTEELTAIVEIAARHGVPLLPRGSGSSLAGQTIGTALVIDCTRHLNRILAIDPEAHTATVEPGVVLNAFNAEAGKYGLQFGPDPASADRATFGGMIGNNSTGAHSILYGMTSDNVLALDVILADGRTARLEAQSIGEAERLAAGEGSLAALYRASLDVRRRYAEEIRARWPKTWRRASGYALNYLLGWSASAPPRWEENGLGPAYPPVPDDGINLAQLMAGSEGTLAVFRRAQVHLARRPKHTCLGVLAYDSIVAACEATPGLLALAPSAVELIPRALINRARAVPAYAARLGFVRGDPAAILVVEFAGDDPQRLLEQTRALRTDVVIAETTTQQAEVWAVRKVGLGLLMSVKGDAKPLPFVEDMAVPVERLAEFVRGFERILAEHSTSGDFYAHASAGCLHVRPLINLKTEQGVAQMRAISAAVVELTLGLGGALSGEHGDGLSHAEWLARGYGEKLTAAVEHIKRAADPHGLLNPGKVINSQKMHENLRYGPDYRAEAWQPLLDFSNQESLLGAIEMCNGAGVCRKDGGVMCPSFQATREEEHSTRGRANLLRGMLSGRFPTAELADEAVHDALDLCLECKGCKAECPSGVDMAKIKYEYLHHYHQSHRRPLRDYLFGYIGGFARLGRTLGPLGNLGMGLLPKRALGLATERSLPRLAGKRFSVKAQGEGERVLFLSDAFTEYFYPEVGAAAVEMLEAAGCDVTKLPLVGAGRTLISKGFLPQARAHAVRALAAVAALDPLGTMPVVGVEPSELLTLRDEYLELMPGNEVARRLAKRAFLVDEFMVRPGLDGRPRAERLAQAGRGQKALFHGHCYQKAQPPADDGYPSGPEATKVFLEGMGYQAEMIPAGCCGMAGSFGYEAAHYEVSMQVGELALFPAVRAAGDVALAAAGVSCRAQIEAGTGRKAVHPVMLLAGAFSE